MHRGISDFHANRWTKLLSMVRTHLKNHAHQSARGEYSARADSAAKQWSKMESRIEKHLSNIGNDRNPRTKSEQQLWSEAKEICNEFDRLKDALFSDERPTLSMSRGTDTDGMMMMSRAQLEGESDETRDACGRMQARAKGQQVEELTPKGFI
jgi:hypothetical protein